MNRIKSTIFLLVFFASLTFAQKADDLIGKYRLPNKLDVEIFKDNGKYFGKIVALNGYEAGQTKDVKNPEKDKRNTQLIGMLILKDLEYNQKEKEWINGNMYGPEKGMIFNLKVTEMRKGEIEVVGSKYFFWKTLVWKKI